jgi:lactoylglutathione lyase
MRINHIALYTNDLEKMKEFYEKYFNAKANNMYHNKTSGLKTFFLLFEDNTRLEIMTRPNIDQPNQVLIQLGYIHLAFSIGSREGVDDGLG